VQHRKKLLLHCSLLAILTNLSGITVGGLTEIPGDILVFYHVSDLSLHSDVEQNEEVEHKDWPEHGHVEYREEGQEQTNEHGLRAREPELELWQSSRKRSAAKGQQKDSKRCT
jgi:hypothetical protein